MPRKPNFGKFVRQVRRNKFLTQVQHDLGISDRSTGRQMRRLGSSLQNQIKGFQASALQKYGNPSAASVPRRISGSGDYQMHSGLKMMRGKHERGRMSDHPRSSLNEKGEMCISHSEYVGDLISGTANPTAFTAQNYTINPGNAGLFPWLSATAINFQNYRFKKLVIELRPLVSESTSSSNNSLLSMGAMMMGTQYDSTSGPYTTKATLENSDFAVSVKPSEHCFHAIECNPHFNPLGELYVSSNTAVSSVSNADIRMQSLGILNIASQNVPTASSTAVDLAEIWVHYSVELFKPQLNAGLSNLNSGHWITNTACGAPATTTPFGPNVNPTAGAALVQPTAQAGSQLQILFNSNGTVQFPLAITQGSYLMVYSVIGTGATINTAGWAAVAGTGATLLQTWSSSTAADARSFQQAPENTIAGDTNYICCCIVSINAPGSTLAQVQLETTVIPTAGFFDLFITPYNTLIVS